MDIRFQSGGPSAWQASAVISFARKGERADKACPELANAAPWLAIAPAWRDFKGKKDELAVMYGPEAMDIPRVLVLGLGDGEKLKPTSLRNAIGKAVRAARELGAQSLGLDLAALARAASGLNLDPAALAREGVIAALLSLYRYEQFLTDTEGRAEDPAWLALLLPEGHVSDDVQAAVRLAEAEAAGICLARDLANGPANLITPDAFSAQAREVAQRYGMKCRVLDRKDMEEEKMGSLLGVAQGAKHEPRFIVMEYSPKGTEGQDPVILVGKGITFDSGGISLKPSAGMAEMKCDMSGAGAVLGVFEALGQLAPHRQPSRPVIGLMPCTENMPGGNALRPGDILMSKGGKSVEVLNTDAEGRLILIDALAYAQEKYAPAVMVDIATLTGACAVALGDGAAGLFSDDEALCARILAHSETLGERLWRLPLWEDTSREALKSNVADLANVGPRNGGSIHAAVFLKQFVKDGLPWAHLDIAAADNAESPINAKGATGFGVRTLLQLVW